MVEAVKNLASRTVDGLDQLSDEELVSACQAELPHDLTHYREILRRYEGLVYNTCRKVLGNDQDAQEVSQDALIQIYHKITQFEGRSQFRTWLYTIVHNYCRQRIGKIIRKREGEQSFQKQTIMDDFEMPEATERRALSEHLEKVLETLRDPEREIITLKFVSGLTLEEISEVTELSLSATKMRLYRALDAFKEAYQRSENSPIPSFQTVNSEFQKND